MAILRAILIIIEILCSVLLIGVILLQKAKDEGLGLAFGQGVGETLFGSRAGNVLTKITIGLAVVFLINTLLIGITYTGMGRQSSSIVDKLPAERPTQGQPAQPAAPLTGGDAGSVPPLAPTPAPSTPAPSTPAPEAPVTAPPPAPVPAPSGGTP